MGDKVSGAMMKLRGSMTRRPGLKVSRTSLAEPPFPSSAYSYKNRRLELAECMELMGGMLEPPGPIDIRMGGSE
jgi:hypothetical protein